MRYEQKEEVLKKISFYKGGQESVSYWLILLHASGTGTGMESFEEKEEQCCVVLTQGKVMIDLTCFYYSIL
jgi:hypothetical protein